MRNPRGNDSHGNGGRQTLVCLRVLGNDNLKAMNRFVPIGIDDLGARVAGLVLSQFWLYNEQV